MSFCHPTIHSSFKMFEQIIQSKKLAAFCFIFRCCCCCHFSCVQIRIWRDNYKVLVLVFLIDWSLLFAIFFEQLCLLQLSSVLTSYFHFSFLLLGFKNTLFLCFYEAFDLKRLNMITFSQQIAVKLVVNFTFTQQIAIKMIVYTNNIPILTIWVRFINPQQIASS